MEPSTKGQKKDTSKPTPDLSKDGAGLCQMLLAHVTQNRLQNVLSKLPDVCTAKDCGRVCGLLSQDAMEDFKKDFGDSFDALGKKERKAIQKCFASDVMTLVRATLR